jgi:hypothetical protein
MVWYGMVWYGMVWCPSYPLDRNRCDQVVAAGSGAGRRLSMLRLSPFRPRLFGGDKVKLGVSLTYCVSAQS